MGRLNRAERAWAGILAGIATVGIVATLWTLGDAHVPPAPATVNRYDPVANETLKLKSHTIRSQDGGTLPHVFTAPGRIGYDPEQECITLYTGDGGWQRVCPGGGGGGTDASEWTHADAGASDAKNPRWPKLYPTRGPREGILIGKTDDTSDNSAPARIHQDVDGGTPTNDGSAQPRDWPGTVYATQTIRPASVSIGSIADPVVNGDFATAGTGDVPFGWTLQKGNYYDNPYDSVTCPVTLGGPGRTSTELPNSNYTPHCQGVAGCPAGTDLPFVRLGDRADNGGDCWGNNTVNALSGEVGGFSIVSQTVDCSGASQLEFNHSLLGQVVGNSGWSRIDVLIGGTVVYQYNALDFISVHQTIPLLYTCAGQVVLTFRLALMQDPWDDPSEKPTSIHAAYAATGANAFPGPIVQPAFNTIVLVKFSGTWNGGNVLVTGLDQFGYSVSDTIVSTPGSTVLGTTQFTTVLTITKTVVGTLGTASVGTPSLGNAYTPNTEPTDIQCRYSDGSLAACDIYAAVQPPLNGFVWTEFHIVGCSGPLCSHRCIGTPTGGTSSCNAITSDNGQICACARSVQWNIDNIAFSGTEIGAATIRNGGVVHGYAKTGGISNFSGEIRAGYFESEHAGSGYGQGVRIIGGKAVGRMASSSSLIATGDRLVGWEGSAEISAQTGAVNDVVGLVGRSDISDSTLTTGRAIGTVRNVSAEGVNNRGADTTYMLDARAPTGSGTIGTLAGLHIEDLTSATATTRWGIFSEFTGASSLAGSLAIGTFATVGTTLTVGSSATIGTSATVGTTLGVTGATTLGSTLTAASTTTLATGGGNVTIGGGTTASELRVLEASGSGTNHFGLVVPPLAGNTTYTVPIALPAGSGYALTSTPGGVLSWVASLSGSVTGTGTPTRVAFFDSASSISSNANLYWDNTNSRLGIGVTTPGASLGIKDNSGTVSFFTSNFIDADFVVKTTASGASEPLATIGPSSGSLALQTAGTERMRIRADNGFVGIGISPSIPFHVAGANRDIGTAFPATVFVDSTDASPGATIDKGGSIGFRGNTNFPNSGRTFGYIAGRKENAAGGDFNGYLQFGTGFGTGGPTILFERMRITSAGDVGIGTPGPGERLHVIGNARISGLGVSLPVCTNASSTLVTTGCAALTTVPFSGITSGTNTTAAMLVGTGASLDFTGTGTINASTLLGNTWAAPQAIGSTTPAAGTFTTLQANSTFTASAGQRGLRVTKTANYTITTADYYVGVKSLSAAVTITLPPATSACSGATPNVFVVKDEDGNASSNNITIDGDGAELIDGSATKVIGSDYGSLNLISDCVSAYYRW